MGERTRAKAHTVRPTVDDNATLLIEWANGQTGMARTLWGTSYLQNTLTIYGRHGTLWTSVFGGDVIIHSPEKEIAGAERVTWNGQPHCYKVAIRKLAEEGDQAFINHFVDCIEGKATPTCGGEQALHTHEILFKSYEAARTGSAQKLETTFTPWHPIDPKFFDTKSQPI